MTLLAVPSSLRKAITLPKYTVPMPLVFCWSVKTTNGEDQETAPGSS